ncbi:MAG: pyruvate ferredoxin oxidoreductase [Candidatus Saganbacteria bacterium]|nr:pyruvate ferredoxin oxidoreductase [Candidatus Saganbacteria bacterium]
MVQIAAKTGNEAMAEAMRQINPDVVAAYPITPATEIVMIFSQFVADGLVNTEYVAVESEHSAMSATIAASAAGARAMTGTSSQGLALMYEMLPIASALRLPIVMPEVNRALSGPINIHNDHSDTMAARDFGWIQIFSENSQEAYDNLLQAVKIAEHTDVRLPVMVTTDGFIISHCLEKIEMLDDNVVKDYVGKFPAYTNLLDLKNPVTIGALDLQNYYFEHKMQAAEAMRNAGKIILEVGKDFGKKFGREYGYYEKYMLDDADIAVVCMGSVAGSMKEVVNEYRAKGVKIGLLKLRVFRPFPEKEIADALENIKAIAVIDRCDGYAAKGGPLFEEIKCALYERSKRPLVADYICGLGGREVTQSHLNEIVEDLKAISSVGKIKIIEETNKAAQGEPVKQVVSYKGVR